MKSTNHHLLRKVRTWIVASVGSPMFHEGGLSDSTSFSG